MTNHMGKVPDWLDPEYIQNILRKIENSHDLEVSKIDITPGSEEGDNYACQIFRIRVYFNADNQEKEISLIGKYKVMTKLIEVQEVITDPFVTEAHFFNDMPPLFKKAHKTELEFLTKCFYADWEKNLILMEDLVTLNYNLQPKRTFLNKKQCALVMESLAELHGASYAALKIQPNLKIKFSHSLHKDKTEGPLKIIIDNSLKCLKKCIKIFGLPFNQEEGLLKIKEELDVNWFSVCNLKDDRLNFLLHGDCWINNIMFHSSGDKIKLLDFQLYNYNSFANDLQYFLFSSADAKVVVNDIDYLLETYYMKLHSVFPNIPTLTLDRVKKEFAERNFFGYVIAAAIRPAITCYPPPNLEAILEGKNVSVGYDSETYIEHLPILMEYFEKIGMF